MYMVVKLATLVEGDQKAPFSVASTPRCMGGRYSIPWIGIMVRVFANGPGVIPNTLKMLLDASLLNSQHYKVSIKGKVEKSGERSSAIPYTLV